jgi:hypothetical protein
MNKLNHTVLASLALCAVAFTQSAIAEEQVKSDVITKSLPQPAVIKPVNTTVPPGYGNATPSTKKPTVSNTTSTNSKGCNPPIIPCK